MSALIDLEANYEGFSAYTRISDLLFVPFLCPCPWLEEGEEQLSEACVCPHCGTSKVKPVRGGSQQEDEQVEGHLGWHWLNSLDTLLWRQAFPTGKRKRVPHTSFKVRTSKTGFF